MTMSCGKRHLNACEKGEDKELGFHLETFAWRDLDKRVMPTLKIL